MEWTNEMTLKLIDAYRKCNALWHTDSSNYRNAAVRADNWQEIANEFGCSVHEIRKKLASLLASFRRERLKELRAKDSWKSKWFAFKAMSFLHLNKPILVKSDDDPFSEIGNNTSTDDEDSEGHPSEETAPIEEVHLEEKLSLSNEPTKNEEIKSPFVPIKLTLRSKQSLIAPTSSSSSSPSSSKIRKLNNGNKILKIEESTSTSTPKSSPQNNDSSKIFGDYVATKLSSYQKRTQNVVQHKINNILYDADMGNFDET